MDDKGRSLDNILLSISLVVSNMKTYISTTMQRFRLFTQDYLLSFAFTIMHSPPKSGKLYPTSHLPNILPLKDIRVTHLLVAHCCSWHARHLWVLFLLIVGLDIRGHYTYMRIYQGNSGTVQIEQLNKKLFLNRLSSLICRHVKLI